MNRTRTVVSVNPIRERAEKAKRTPDLEWAYDLVHGLADDVLALLADREKLVAMGIHFEDRTRAAESEVGRLRKVEEAARPFTAPDDAMMVSGWRVAKDRLRAALVGDVAA